MTTDATSSPPDAALPGRDPRTNRFTAGNQAARTHGRYSRHGESPDQRAEHLAARAVREAEIIEDLGGEENLTALDRSLVTQAVTLEILMTAFEQDLASTTLTAAARRTLSAAYLKASAGWARISDRLTGIIERPAAERPRVSEEQIHADWLRQVDEDFKAAEAERR